VTLAIRARAAASLAFAAGIALCTTGTTPIAHADPFGGPAPPSSRCVPIRPAPFDYNVDLENVAQQFARNDSYVKNVTWPGYTGDNIQLLDGYGDPQSAAIDGLMSGAWGFVSDCRYKDYGVGFVRVGERDTVSLALGQGLPFAKFATGGGERRRVGRSARHRSGSRERRRVDARNDCRTARRSPWTHRVITAGARSSRGRLRSDGAMCSRRT
jgi:hypothetical protein